MRNRNAKIKSAANSLRAPAALVLAFLAATFSPGFNGWQDAHAQATDIATLPVFSSAPPVNAVKPNVFFILDDSGSMRWTHMPDQADDFAGRYGFASTHCNGIYYNPNVTYTPPVDSSGTSYANQSFTAAAIDGYGLITGTVDLSVGFRAAINNEIQATITSDSAEPAYYYVYSGTQTTEKQKNYYDINSVFYKECRSTIGTTTAHDGTNAVNTRFTKKVVSATSGPGATDERTNFANWYSYYRYRMNMMKTATGLAFKTLDDKFRVGFMTINGNSTSAFLNINDFAGTQRTSFYSKLYAATSSNSTPIRESLSQAGRLYANKISSINGVTTTDPVQYSCQQNYTILSTDGVWNGNAGVRLDGSTAIGNQDGALPRPYNDGSQVTTTIVTPYTSTQDRTTNAGAGSITNTWTRNNTVVGASCDTRTVPGNTASAPMNIGNSRTGALYARVSDPDGSEDRCELLAPALWMCRTGSSTALPSGGTASGVSSNGITWYLVSNVSGNSGCRTARTIFNNSDYSNTAGACPGTGFVGNRVTSTPENQVENISSYSSTNVDRYLATQTRTQTIVNGVPGSVGPMSPSTPAYNLDSNVSFTQSAASRTCGGTAVAYPTTCPASGVGTWTAGTPTVNNQCVATASLPAAGISTPVLSNTSATGATTNTTTNQLTTQVAGTPNSTSVGSGGVADTLADVAAYYYATNLRTAALNNCTGPIISPSITANNLCASNTVPASGVDTATWQHMTTFTLGLGVRGRMVFSPSYLTDTTGDFYDVLKGNTATGTNCTWRDTLTTAGGACNWPVPSSNAVANTDDLWHAAVNGRGNYFSATDPGTLASGLSSTIKAIVNTPKPGTASAAATTNPRITSSNNFQFSSYFKTVEWSGELIRQTMNLADGSVPFYDPFNPDPATYDWSAQVRLDARAYGTRNIYTTNGSALIPFTWADLSGTQKAFFTAPYIATTPPQYPNVMTGLSQFCSTGANCISSTAQSNITVAAGGAAGEALVNFLRGERTNEEVTATTPDNAKFYRYRKSVLGDIVSAQPQYVGAPSRFYNDANYGAYKTLWANRTPVVYTAANDGMLHAFKADHAYDTSTTPPTLVTANGGTELWAYIPSFALPRMYTLADKGYADKHQYFVEGTPISGDICPKAPSLTCADSEWKAILVGGLNAGGTGYYALDITDPASPKLLWEFSHASMGYTFGKPQITKLDNGQWVVLLTSGYNDCPRGTGAAAACALNGSGDGQGRLFVLDANTGVQLTGSPIATGVGTDTDPSGLGQILAHANSSNVTTRVYGGDLKGNLWRFSLATASAFSVHKLATLKDGSGNVQPITVRPQVTTINSFPVVYVGTGRYLGASDVGGTVQNSFYAIKDDLTTTTTYNSPRTFSSFIGQAATDTTCPMGTDVSICLPGQSVRTVTQTTGSAGDSLQSKNGWYVDFPAASNEIQFTDPKLTLGTLAFSTSVPRAATSEACTPRTGASDGDAFGYMLDYLTGGAVGTSGRVIATNLGSGVATAPQIAQLPNGTVIAKFRLSTGQEVGVPLRFSSGGGATKRVSWRELISE